MKKIASTVFVLTASLLGVGCQIRGAKDATLSESTPNPAIPAGGLLDGAFVFLGGETSTRFPPDKIPAMLDEFVELKMKTLIFSGVRPSTGKCSEGKFVWGKDLPDKLGLILDGAAARGQEVYLSVSSSADVCNGAQRILYAKKIAADADRVAGEIHKRWGSHPAFKGWYIPDEPGTPEPLHFPFYKGMADAIRKHSELPIVVAPYLATTTRILAPMPIAALAKSFMNATKDAKGRPIIQAWQDSVGATGVDLNWRRGDPGIVEDYFKAISNAIGKDNFWADVEVFNCCVPPFGGGAYAASSALRLNQQMWAARTEYTAKRVSWLPQIHMGAVDPEHFQDAERLKAAYLALNGVKGRFVTPASYEWLTLPDPKYADAGKELLDRVTADPKKMKNAGWVGVNGDARLLVDFGAETPLNFIGVHVLNDPKPSIGIPSEIQLKCLDEDQKTKKEHKEPRGFEPADSSYEYVLSNYKPLDWSCRFVEIGLPNGKWTFLSELEITGP